MSPSRVLLVDDHPVVLQGVAKMLRGAADFGEVVQASSGTVSVHPGAAAGSQDRSRGAGVDGAVDGAGYCRWQGRQDYLAAVAGHA